MTLNPADPEEIANMSRSPWQYYMKHIFKIYVHALLFSHFFKDNVREYFSLSEQKKWKPILAEFCIGIGIIIVINIFMRVIN